MLYITLVRSHLTYYSQLWRPHFLKDIANLERIQRRSTKYILGDYARNYKERLTTWNIFPLMYWFSLQDLMFPLKCLKDPDDNINIHRYITLTSAGFASFRVWPDWYNLRQNLIYPQYEVLWKLDCVDQIRGMYDCAFSFDTNGFSNPQMPAMTNVKDFIVKWCYGNSTSSCSFEWVYYFPGACAVKDELVDDGNVPAFVCKKSFWQYKISPHDFRSP